MKRNVPDAPARRLGWLLLALLGLLLARPGRAQPGPQQPAFLRAFGPAEGLRQPFIYTMLQDRQGYLWLGTAEGLVRYDGRRFITFTRQDGLAEDFVVALGEDAGTGRLWVGHYEGGISLRPAPDQLFRPTNRAAVPAALPLPANGAPAADTAAIGRYLRRYRLRLPAEVMPTCLLEDREGQAWIGTAGQGLWRHADRHLRLVPDTLQPGQKKLPADPRLPAGVRVTCWAWASWDQAYWVGTAADGLYCLPPVGPARHYTTENGLLHNSISALMPDQSGRLWVGTRGTGLAYFDEGQGTFVRQQLPPVPLNVTGFAQSEDGVWVGTEGQGLYCLRGGRKWQHFDTTTGLPSDYISGLLALPRRGSSRLLLLVHGQGLSLLQDQPGGPVFTPLASADNPLVQELLPQPGRSADSSQAFVRSRRGTLVVNLRELPAPLAPPGLAITEATVDGEPRAPFGLGELSAGRHRLDFRFQGLSLLPGAALQYQYRLFGLAAEWSRPSAAGEAQFPGLDAGAYRLEVRVRRGPAGPWSAAAALEFGIATPVWRRPWFAAVLALLAVGMGGAVVRTREKRLRQRQQVLERTVQARTAELRQQKARTEEINADLLVARDAAEAASRAKAQFLANMSHEIRTPMNAVVGLTHLLQGTHPSPEQAEYLTAIASSSQNLLVIINDILDSSKMEAGKLTLEQVPFRLPEAVQRLQALFRFATESKGLHFAVNVAPEVPAAVVGDPVRLNQVLVNLVGNAIKFTRQGSVTVAVDVANSPEPLTPTAPPTRVRFVVRDTGIGIAADKLGAIFEDFSQANTSTTREFGGTGLGLSIARSLVQLHGGQLGVRSEEGRGSEFFFELSYEVADADAARPEAQHGRLQPFDPALRVLVAEDNDLNQLVARKTLEAWNVEVVIAPNGRLAVAAATGARPPFDAVLMDVQMPEMDGYEAARHLRRLFPDPGQLPIIGLTASALPEDRALALAAGMNDTLAKPFEPAVLYARLAYFTGRSGAPAAPLPEASAAPAGAPMPTPRPNWHLLEELAGGNEDFLRQIVATFLREAPAQEALLTTAGPHTPEALSRAAHKLRGQVAYFGLPALCAQLETLEKAAGAGTDASACQALVLSIRAQLAAVYPLLAERA